MRWSARLVLLDDQDRVFLFKFEDTVAVDPAKPGLLVYALFRPARAETTTMV